MAAARSSALRRAGVCLVAGGGLLTAVSLTQMALESTVHAGFSAGSACKLFGTGNYKGLSADCPTGYLPASTKGPAYTSGQTFSFSVVVHNPTSHDVTVQTAW